MGDCPVKWPKKAIVSLDECLLISSPDLFAFALKFPISGTNCKESEDPEFVREEGPEKGGPMCRRTDLEGLSLE